MLIKMPIGMLQCFKQPLDHIFGYCFTFTCALRAHTQYIEHRGSQKQIEERRKKRKEKRLQFNWNKRRYERKYDVQLNLIKDGKRVEKKKQRWNRLFELIEWRLVCFSLTHSLAVFIACPKPIHSAKESFFFFFFIFFDDFNLTQ